jgi:8-oxo-dGTP diphosphatase
MAHDQPRRPEVAVGAITINHNPVGCDSVLLVQRANPPQQGKWSLPGGRIEWGETAVAAAAREVHEETGIEVRITKLVEVIERISATHHFVIMDYEAVPVDPLAAAHANTDATDARWVPWDQVASYDLSDLLLEFFRQHGYLTTPN